MPSPDLTALEAVNALAHFGDQDPDPAEGEDGWEASRTALRAAMGAAFASSPADADLEVALAEAVAYLEGATGRIFLARAGTLKVDGTGTHRLFLPLPVVSTGQLEGAGVTEITIGADTTPLDSDGYLVNDGAGLPGRDPRDSPTIDLVAPSSGGSFVSRPPGFGGWRTWPEGVRNVNVTATWGYLDENGATPLLARKALAGLAVRALGGTWDDRDGLDDLHLGAVTTESTRDRSVSYGERAGGGGITTDRELDLLIARLRAPPLPRVPRAPRRRVRDARDALLGPVRGY